MASQIDARGSSKGEFQTSTTQKSNIQTSSSSRKQPISVLLKTVTPYLQGLHAIWVIWHIFSSAHRSWSDNDKMIAGCAFIVFVAVYFLVTKTHVITLLTSSSSPRFGTKNTEVINGETPSLRKARSWVLGSAVAFISSIVGLYYFFMIIFAEIFPHTSSSSSSSTTSSSTTSSSLPSASSTFSLHPEENSAGTALFLRISHTEPYMTREILLIYTISLLLDIVVGYIEYREQIGILTGYVHHTLYICVCIWLLENKISGGLGSLMTNEVPTLLLGVGSIYKPFRTDLGFGLAFFIFRIVFDAYVVVVHYLYAENRVFVLISAPVFCLHMFWFYSWCVSYAKKLRSEAVVAAGKTTGKKIN